MAVTIPRLLRQEGAFLSAAHPAYQREGSRSRGLRSIDNGICARLLLTSLYMLTSHVWNQRQQE